MNRKEILILIFLLILTVILRLPSLFEPGWHRDEGITLTVGNALKTGEILYKDIADNKTPLLYFLASIFNTVFLFKTLLFFWALGAVLVFYFLTKELLKNRGIIPACLIMGILTSLPLIEGNIGNGEIFFLLPNLTGIYFVLWALKKERDKYLIPAGVFWGIGFLIKIPAVFDMFPLLIIMILYYSNWIKKIFLIIFGFLIPLIPILLYFIWNRAITDFWEYGFKWNFIYSSYKNELLIPYGGLLIKTIPLIFLFLSAYVLKNRITKNLLFFLVWLIFLFIGANISMRHYIHYYFPLIIPLALILGYIYNSSRRVFYLFLFALISCWYLINPGSIHYQVNYYQNFYLFITHKKTTADYRNWFDPFAERNYKIAKYLQEKKAGPIFVFGDEPFIYILSGRQPVVRFPVAYNINFEKKRKIEALKKISIYKPIYILKIKPEKYHLTGLNEFLNKKYQQIKEIEGIIIYERQI